MSLPADAEALRSGLLAWFERARRELPWRERRTPYRVWVSEVMLQQTRVEVVVPYYQRFLARFPDIAALAAASEEQVLELWSGLGYYRRARNLLKGARFLAGRGADFPTAWKEALAVPGIGEYTAAAILSLAHGLPHAAVDGNIVRVLARLFGVKADPTKGPGKRRIRELAAALLDREQPGRWNEAMMELGALVCSKRPHCLLCPWRGSCVAARTGQQALLPALPARRARVDVIHGVAVIQRAGRLLLRRRGSNVRLARMWELPGCDLVAPVAGELRTGLAGVLAVAPATEPRWRCRHGITHHRIEVYGFDCQLQGEVPVGKDWRWETREVAGGLALTGIARKLLRLLGGRP